MADNADKFVLVLQFLDEVEEIKKKAEEEEQRRIEVELASKKKRSHIKKATDGDKTPGPT